MYKTVILFSYTLDSRCDLVIAFFVGTSGWRSVVSIFCAQLSPWPLVLAEQTCYSDTLHRHTRTQQTASWKKQRKNKEPVILGNFVKELITLARRIPSLALKYGAAMGGGENVPKLSNRQLWASLHTRTDSSDSTLGPNQTADFNNPTKFLVYVGGLHE